MARVSLSRGFRTRSPGRRVGWSPGPKSAAQGASVGFSATGAILGTISSQATLDGLTIVRLRGECTAQLVTASSQGDGFSCAVGVALVTTAALTAGVASVPTPLTEEGWDGWLYHRYFQLFAGAAIAAATAAQQIDLTHPTSAAVRFEVDSKAMRKDTVDNAVMVVFEAVEVGTASGR